MLRKLLLCLVVVLTASAAVASSLSVTAGGLATGPATDEELAGRSLGDLIYQGMNDPRFEARLQHWLGDHGLDHPQRLDLAGASPIDVARSKLNAEPRLGRSVAEWVQLANAQSLLALEPQTAPRADADLVDEVARLAAAYDVVYTPAQMAEMRTSAAAIPADLRAPFAALVSAMADATLAQAPIAEDVMSRMRKADLAFRLTDAEREATLVNALGLVAAQNAFRLAVADAPHVATPAFSDPAGLVILGSSGDDTFARTGQFQDAALIVDPSGNDTYQQLAGGACPDTLNLIHECNGLVAAMVVDLLGDDDYTYTGAPTNSQASASLGAIGILVDVAGSDLYYSNFIQKQRVGDLWGGVLGYIDAGNQGYALAGVGILLDATGDDVYEGDVTTTWGSIWGFSQGFGNAGGVGIAADGSGDDDWLAYGFDTRLDRGFQGLYPGGSGFFGGLGIMADTGLGRDEYKAWDNASSTDFYAYGFGAFGGTGIFYEDGGDDDYTAVESATGAAGTTIIPLLNCAYGTASFAGLGAFLEMGGNDNYFGDSITGLPRPVATMNEGFGGPAEGEGIFVDVSGDDGHFMEAHPNGVLNYAQTYGRGAWLGGGEGLVGNTFGVYLDLAGDDVYTGAAPSQNNAVWPAGLDLEAGMVPGFFIN